MPITGCLKLRIFMIGVLRIICKYLTKLFSGVMAKYNRLTEDVFIMFFWGLSTKRAGIWTDHFPN